MLESESIAREISKTPLHARNLSRIMIMQYYRAYNVSSNRRGHLIFIFLLGFFEYYVE